MKLEKLNFRMFFTNTDCDNNLTTTYDKDFTNAGNTSCGQIEYPENNPHFMLTKDRLNTILAQSDAKTKVKALFDFGINGSAYEQGLLASYKAIEKNLALNNIDSRFDKDALKVLIIVSDENDHSFCKGANENATIGKCSKTGTEVMTAIKENLSAKNHTLLYFPIAITHEKNGHYGSRYKEARSVALNGEIFSLYKSYNNTTGAISDLTAITEFDKEILPKIATQVGTLAASFNLSKKPANSDKIEVILKNAVLPKTAYTYNAASNSILFVDSALAPKENESFEVKYSVVITE